MAKIVKEEGDTGRLHIDTPLMRESLLRPLLGPVYFEACGLCAGCLNDLFQLL